MPIDFLHMPTTLAGLAADAGEAGREEGAFADATARMWAGVGNEQARARHLQLMSTLTLTQVRCDDAGKV